VSKEKALSLIKGFSFSFEDDGKEIKAWFSAISGLEKVYVDGELVSSQRNLSSKSSCIFSIGPNEYSVNMKAVSLLEGPYVCTLNKNGKEYKRQKLLQSRNKPFFVWIAFVFSAALSGLLVLAAAYWQLPVVSFTVFGVISTVVSVAYAIQKEINMCVIEDESINH